MMQTARILQAVTLLLILAMAASCATTNQYVSKVFKPRNAPQEAMAKAEPRPVKFLEFDNTESENESWVKDWVNKTDQDSAISVMKSPIKNDSTFIVKTQAKKDTVFAAPAKTEPLPDSPLARSTTTGGVRTKAKRD